MKGELDMMPRFHPSFISGMMSQTHQNFNSNTMDRNEPLFFIALACSQALRPQTIYFVALLPSSAYVAQQNAHFMVVETFLFSLLRFGWRLEIKTMKIAIDLNAPLFISGIFPCRSSMLLCSPLWFTIWGSFLAPYGMASSPVLPFSMPKPGCMFDIKLLLLISWEESHLWHYCCRNMDSSPFTSFSFFSRELHLDGCISLILRHVFDNRKQQCPLRPHPWTPF